MKKYTHKPILTIAALTASLFVFTACDVEQTEEGEMPSVDVDVEGGNMPEYDVETADVDVGTTEKTVSVPKVRVVVEEETVEVPYVNIEWPDEAGNADTVERRTVTTRVQVPASGYDLRITEILRESNEIHVISEIVRNNRNEMIDSAEGIPVQDTVVFDAPDYDINRYVITDLEDVEETENDLEIVRNRNEIDIDWDTAESLYTANTSR